MERESMFYSTSVGYSEFYIHSRYTDLKMIGDGSFGLVASAVDTKMKRKVAIKKVQLNSVDAKSVLREVKLLGHFNAHDNIISLLDIMNPSYKDRDDVYIVTNFMDRDLCRVIQSKQVLTAQHVQYILFQILRGLKYIHSANVLHRDLKPSNVLINANCDVMLCDFGLSRGIDNQCDELTEYVVTRWYRPPELLLRCSNYGKPVDVWSVGCIFAELLLREPIFRGETPQHQLRVIITKLGSPTSQERSFVDSAEGLRELTSIATLPKADLRGYFPKGTDAGALSLLHQMLCFNPGDRISVQQALAHPYLQAFHAHWSEPVCDKVFDFNFERSPSGTKQGGGALSDQEVRRLLHGEVQKYQPFPSLTYYRNESKCSSDSDHKSRGDSAFRTAKADRKDPHYYSVQGSDQGSDQDSHQDSEHKSAQHKSEEAAKVCKVEDLNCSSDDSEKTQNLQFQLD